MNSKTTFSLALLGMALLANAQPGPIPCAFDLVHQHALQDTAFRRQHQLLEQQAFDFFQKPVRPETAAGGVIPVAVHIIHDNGPENIPDAQVKQAIAWLNQAFANTGPYAQGSGADTDIRFCLAQRTPDGQPTNGITRNQSPLTVMADILANDLAVKNLNRWAPKEYLNIWVVRSICSNTYGCGVTAYAYQPGYHGLPVDGVVIEAAFFGSTPGYVAALTHETGHYLGLYHTFEGGCKNSNCLQDGDRVCDTPPDQSTAAVPCGQMLNTCTTDAQSGFSSDQPDMTWNFMDYGDYNCMHDFTAGQAARMQFFLNGARKSLLAGKGCQPPCPAPTLAAFTPSATSVNAGQTVVFYNQSQNFGSLQWILDGTPFSTAPSPSYTFNAPGLYTVSLQVQPANTALCEPATATAVIQVLCPVVAAFAVSNLYPLVNEPVIITNNSQQATQFEWFLDGASQGAKVDTLAFSQPGTYAVQLVAGNGFCTKSLTREITVVKPDSCLSYNFIKTYDRPGIWSEWSSVRRAPDGNLYLATLFSTNIVEKTDADGNLLWAKTLDLANEQIYALSPTADMGVVLVSNAQLSPYHSSIVKLDANGNVEWRKTASQVTAQGVAFFCITPTNDFGFLIGGTLHPQGGGSSGAYYLKIDANGNQLWSKLYRGGSNDVRRILQLDDGGFLSVGSSTAVRLDKVGSLLWSRWIDGGPFSDVIKTANGHILLVAGSASNSFCYPNSALIKITLDGNVLWKRTYGSPGKTCLRSVARGNFGGYVAVGMTEGNIASPNESFITWLDDEGKPLKARLYDPAEGFHFDELIRTPGGYALAGTADAPQGTGILLAKMDEAGNTGLCTTAPAQLSSTLSTIPSTPVDETPAQAPEISTGQAASANLVLQEILRCAYACDTLVIQPEICNNNLDDDGDGLFDCLDPDCDCPENACAPGQALTWYFGRGSGLDFSTGPPSVLTGGQTDNLMSSAVANDAKGNLLFYSDGKTVYNRFHQPMPNGQLQTGAGPAQCESIILPHPGNSKIFYLATAAAGAFGAPALVSYSVIDISLDGGRGDVAAGQKLLPLWPGGGKVLPRIAAVRSCFFNGYWLVLRAYEPQAGFLSFRLDPGGLKTTPVVSAAGAIPAVFGQMKLSPDGLLLAETDQQGKSVCVYNFDPYSSGKVSAVPRFVANLPYAPFGLEFSPKGRLLYVSVWDESPATFHSEILQFDLQTAAGPDISTNAAKIAALPGTSGIVLLGAMQLGPDGKIYVSSTTATNQFKTNLHVIHWPEKSGSACHFQENALSLAPPPGASAGLCNFPASLFASPHIAFPANAPDTICRPGQTALYQITDVLCNVNTITWTLEGLPGTVQSNYQYASILYTEPGEGRLILTAHTGCGSVSDTMRVFVFDDPPPPKLDLGPDRVVCDNGVYRFEAGGGFARYRWQDGSSDSIYTTTLPGRYWVDAWDRCGNRQTDTITVTVAPATVLDLGPDWQGCPGTTLAYIRPAIFSRWQWLPAGFLSCDTCAAVQTAPAANRTYQIIAQTAGGCISVDTLTFTPYDTIFVVLDTFICQNETLELLGITLPADTFAQIFQPAAGAGRCDTLWQIAVLGIELATGSFDTVICAGATLFYQGLQIEAGASAELLLPGANGCDSILTIKVGAFLPLSASLPPDTTLRIGDTLMLEPEVAGAGPFAYSWAPEGSAPCANCPAIWVSPYQSLWYALAVSDANGCQAQDSIFVAVDSVCRLFPVTAFTPDNDGNNDWFYPKTDPCVRTVLRWQIANRWGQVVFERQHFIPNQESMGWDGRHNGQEAPSDVYIWRAELEYYDGKKTGVKGAVTLLR